MAQTGPDLSKPRSLAILKQDWRPDTAHDNNGTRNCRNSICHFCCFVGSVADDSFRVRIGALVFGGTPQWLHVNLVYADPLKPEDINASRYLTKALNGYVATTLQQLEADFVERQINAKEAGVCRQSLCARLVLMCLVSGRVPTLENEGLRSNKGDVVVSQGRGQATSVHRAATGTRRLL